MNEEDYVSLEVTKILYQKGFEIKGVYLWTRGVLCPTLYEAAKWLRKNHNIIVGITCNSTNEWYYSVRVFNSVACTVMYASEKPYKSYEEALNNGILKALKF